MFKSLLLRERKKYHDFVLRIPEWRSKDLVVFGEPVGFRLGDIERRDGKNGK